LLGNSPFLRLKFSCGENKETINSNLIGTYNFNNILAAVTIGNHFGLTPKEIKKGVEDYVPTNNRSQIIEKNSNKIILDAYNANPSSMKEAINNLIVTKSKDKYFVLGDMLEMGMESKKEHQEVISQLEKNNLNGILVGKEFCKIKSDFKTFETTKEAIEFVSNKKFENTLVLIKGSRGIKLESVLDVI
jgi:UDP-N-acetylmuramoyl-tripeptide--D-alanyl-D-alanine ligase